MTRSVSIRILRLVFYEMIETKFGITYECGQIWPGQAAPGDPRLVVGAIFYDHEEENDDGGKDEAEFVIWQVQKVVYDNVLLPMQLRRDTTPENKAAVQHLRADDIVHKETVPGSQVRRHRQAWIAALAYKDITARWKDQLDDEKEAAAEKEEPIVCESCKTENEPDAEFCKKCGESLDEEDEKENGQADAAAPA